MKLRILVGVLLATSIVATPALSAKRKTLFQVLFEKSQERKFKKRQARIEAQRAAQEAAAAKKKRPKVKTSRNYAYRVTKRAPILLVAAPVEFALADNVVSEDGLLTTGSLNVSRLTNDISLAGKQPLKVEKHLAKAISDFYSEPEKQQYYWIDEQGNWNAKARSVISILNAADDFGLKSSDYQIPEISVPLDASNEQMAAIRIKKEIALSAMALRYAMDASFGAVNPNRLSGYHDFPVKYGQSRSKLEKILFGGLPANSLKSMHPNNEKFVALKQELALLQEAKDDLVDLRTDIFIKPGRAHDELPNVVAAIKLRASEDLRAKHDEFFANYAGSVEYTKDIQKVVKDYQKEAGLGPDGIIGPNTATKLAGLSSNKKTTQVKLAMERLRWHPHDLGNRHVFINQPEYRARYISNGKEELSMRVVVGKKSNQTNFFYDEIEHVVYNPYWGVPRSIIVNEFAPKSLGNPGYLDQKGYEITNASGQKISSSSIDWYGVSEYPNFNVRQPPGSKNALGELKIMFPNKHAIYMHDTPAKSLFKKQHRAFSHGCVRLHDPRAMAAAVLGKTKKQIAASIGKGKNETEKLSAKVPVYVSYFTAWPQQDGSVSYFKDMYGRDAHLLKAFDAVQKARQKDIVL